MTTGSRATNTPETPTQGRQRISTQATLELMRLEAERALRHRHPISCLVLGVDLEDPDAARRAAPRVFQELKKAAYARDLRGLGLWSEGVVLAAFPHVDPDDLRAAAEELLDGVRSLEPSELGLPGPLRASIGISHNLHDDPMTFESLVEEAETGMGLAQGAGGDRVVLARDVERELDRLREEVEHQIEELNAYQEELFGNLADQEEVWGKELVDKVIDLFRREPQQSEGLLRVEKEVIALLRFELAEWRKTASAEGLIEAKRTIERLERRVQKLTEGLDLTENELKRVAKMKNIDLGVASIYRTVQGLSSDDGQYEQKKEMLKDIFEANLAFRQELASK